MNSTAFVAVSPVAAARPAIAPATSSFTPSLKYRVAAAPTNRTAVIRMGAKDDNKSIPQGFTLFSEQLNGRAAMMGFVIAIATEAITGQGILGQLSSVTDTVKNVLPF